jgi:ribose 5-phosphate isomerase A
MDGFKQAAGEAAAEMVESGMVVGLGTGSTAVWAVRRIGAKLREGSLQNISAVATSVATAEEARLVGIPLLGEEEAPTVDLTIDGADEVDPQWNLIKGGGGALLREKIVAEMSRRFVVVVEERKWVSRLGAAFRLPVEVVEFGWTGQARFLLDQWGAEAAVRLRPDGSRFRTDQGNLILDCAFPGGIGNPANVAQRLSSRAGIVEHGLFLGMTGAVVTAGLDGVRVDRR